MSEVYDAFCRDNVEERFYRDLEGNISCILPSQFKHVNPRFRNACVIGPRRRRDDCVFKVGAYLGHKMRHTNQR